MNADLKAENLRYVSSNAYSSWDWTCSWQKNPHQNAQSYNRRLCPPRLYLNPSYTLQLLHNPTLFRLQHKPYYILLCNDTFVLEKSKLAHIYDTPLSFLPNLDRLTLYPFAVKHLSFTSKLSCSMSTDASEITVVYCLSFYFTMRRRIRREAGGEKGKHVNERKRCVFN